MGFKETKLELDMVSFTVGKPLEDAVRDLSRRTPLGALLASAEWEMVAARIKRAAFFSSQVEDERLLAEMQERIRMYLAGERRRLADGGQGAFQDKAKFLDEMREILKQRGYVPPEGKAGGLKDLSSAKRLRLIWDMNIAQANGYAAWKADQNETSLKFWPAIEFVRIDPRVERRDWPVKWAAAGGKFYGKAGRDYPEAPGRMMALRNDEIWTRLNRFRVPWRPFDWGSGMGTRKVKLAEALQVGVVDKDSPVQAVRDAPFPAYQGTVTGMTALMEERLRSKYGGNLKIDDDGKINDNNSDGNVDDIQGEITRLAREVAERGRDAFRRSGYADGTSPWPSGYEAGSEEREILASTSAVAAGRKYLYHEEWPSHIDSESLVGILRAYLPDKVTVSLKDGHIHAWRPDLVDLNVDELVVAAKKSENGRLLGYGQNLFDRPSVTVSFSDAKGKVVGGFFTAPETAREYAKIRLKDFTDASDEPLTVKINGKEVEF
jgi:hypothetical protein